MKTRIHAAPAVKGLMARYILETTTITILLTFQGGLLKYQKIRKKIGSGWVGQASTRIFICVFSCVFVVFCTCLKKSLRGWVGLVWPIHFF